MSCTVQEARRFAPHRAPGPRQIVGPHFGQPELNEPTVYLSPKARALVFSARTAFDPDRNVLVPLVYARGRRVRVPLPVAPAPSDLFDRLAQQLSAVPWVWASSYASSAPHYYTKRESWPDDAAFVAAVAAIQRHGYRNRFGMPGKPAAWWQQLDIPIRGKVSTIWAGFELPAQTGWINARRPPPGQRPIPIDPQQTLIAENARAVEIAPGPDPWRALALALFPEGTP